MTTMFKCLNLFVPTVGGVAGIIPCPLFYLLSQQPLALQALKSYRLALLWQVAVICGCLGLLGIGFSTVSAQSSSGTPAERQDLPLTLAHLGHSGLRRQARRRGSGTSRPKHGGGTRGASYSRYSSDLSREESNADQRRTCRECAIKNGHQIQAQFEFADEAISGRKLKRHGLAALMTAAAEGLFDVLYFHNLSRLARESVITMPMLKQLVYVHGIRVISVTEGLDSDREGWDMIATILSIQHEKYLKDLAANVLRGQEGNILAGFSVGDYCFGYGSEPVPGSEQQRRGRNAKPRKIYVIDPKTAPWVMRIFHWFVVERRGLSWIARELNRLKAPKDHRATTPLWRHQQLPTLLRNRKYLGTWPWGEKQNVVNPLTGQVSQDDRPEEETEKWVRHFPHLQLIENETFELAEHYLQENEEKYNSSRGEKGKFKGSSSEAATAEPRHLLSGLLECEHCHSNWYVGGAHGRYLYCTGQKRGICECQTKLRRDRAERLILAAISRQVLADAAWHGAVVDFMSEAWHRFQQTAPNELKSAQEALAEVDRKIARLVDTVEQGPKDPDILERLAVRRAERQPLLNDVERLKRANETAAPEPTGVWVVEQLQHLSEVLSGGGPAAAHALNDLVGGKIFVKQIERPGRKRHFLQGRFTVRLASVVSIAMGGRLLPAPCGSETGDKLIEFVIDFVDDDPNNDLAEEAKRYYDQKLMTKEIAEKMGIWPSQVTKLLAHWSKLHGEALPDGRRRRASLPRKTLVIHQYERVADDAVVLMHKGFSDARIGKKLGCSAFVAGKAIRHWHRVRNLPVPATRERRDVRARLAKQLVDEGKSRKAVAAELECSLPTLGRLLELADKVDEQQRPAAGSQQTPQGGNLPDDEAAEGKGNAA